jgi:hypothetical protein
MEFCSIPGIFSVPAIKSLPRHLNLDTGCLIRGAVLCVYLWWKGIPFTLDSFRKWNSVPAAEYGATNDQAAVT